MGVVGWFQHVACGRIGLQGDAKGHQSLPPQPSRCNVWLSGCVLAVRAGVISVSGRDTSDRSGDRDSPFQCPGLSLGERS